MPVPPLRRQLRRCRCAPIITRRDTRRVTRTGVTRRRDPVITGESVDIGVPAFIDTPTGVELTGSVNTEEARGGFFPIACRSLRGPREEAEARIPSLASFRVKFSGGSSYKNPPIMCPIVPGRSVRSKMSRAQSRSIARLKPRRRCMGDLEAGAGQAQSASGRLIILYHIPVLYP